MDWWREYILSIIGCVLICGIIIQLISEMQYVKTVRLVCGMLLALVILRPLGSADFTDAIDIEIDRFSPECFVDIGKQAAVTAQKQCIMESCEAYIFSKANELDMTVSAQVHLNENLEPDFAQIDSQCNSDQKHMLERILEEDLGITKENQLWISNRENGSS